MEYLFVFLSVLIWTSSANTWTWLGGNSVSTSANYGQQGVSASTNFPGGRDGAAYTTDVNGNLWVFGGIGASSLASTGSLNDLWTYNGATWTWMSGSSTVNPEGMHGIRGVPSPFNVPSGRQHAAIWIDIHGENIWLFGGYNGKTSFNDLWKFNIPTGNWTWVSGSDLADSYGTYGSKGQSANTNAPGARRSHALWGDAANLYVFGGEGLASVESKAENSLNDLWTFSLSSFQWTWTAGSDSNGQHGIYEAQGVSTPISAPGGRSSFAYWIDAAGSFFVYGGQGYDAKSKGALSDMWKFSNGQWTWVSGSSSVNSPAVYGDRNVADVTNTPGSRFGLSRAGTDKQGNVWIFGGNSFDGRRDDLWKWNGATWTWVAGTKSGDSEATYPQINVASDAEDYYPSAKSNHVAWINTNGEFSIFSGSNLVILSNDMWTYTETAADDEVVVLLPEVAARSNEDIKFDDFNFAARSEEELEYRGDEHHGGDGPPVGGQMTTGEILTTGVTTDGLTTGVTTGITTGKPIAVYPCAFMYEIFDYPQVYDRIWVMVYDCRNETTFHDRANCRRLFVTIHTFDIDTQKFCLLPRVESCNKFSQRKFRQNCIRVYDIKVQQSVGCEQPEAAPIYVPLNAKSFSGWADCIADPRVTHRSPTRGVATEGACTTVREKKLCWRPQGVL